MDTLVAKPAERRRRRHSEEFKRQVIEVYLQPGVSVTAIAFANGLNANYLRRWVREHREATAVSVRDDNRTWGRFGDYLHPFDTDNSLLSAKNAVGWLL